MTALRMEKHASKLSPVSKYATVFMTYETTVANM
jgi:hypothetical protein